MWLALGVVLAVACVLFVARPFLRDPAPASDRLDEPGPQDEIRVALAEERDRALAAASLALAVLLLATGHVILGAVLLAVAILLGVVFASLARRLPETPVTRLSLGAMSAMKARAGFAVEALTVHSSARVVLFRHRRELVELLGQRTDAARALGEAVYAGEKDDTKEARAKMKELDGLIAAKEEEMQQTAAGAMERIQR